MRGFDDSLQWFVREAEWLVAQRGLMMVGNLVLATLPVLLALLLFEPRRRRGALWWTGVVAFVLLLPNSAYVLTDVVHLLRDVRVHSSDLSLITVYLPAYAVFFAIGFGSYVFSLLRVRDYVATAAPNLRWWPIEGGAQLLTAVGIFLGRVVRLNSWDVVRAPGDVTSSLPILTTRFPLLFIAFTVVVLVCLTAVAKPTLRTAQAGLVRRLPRRQFAIEQ